MIELIQYSLPVIILIIFGLRIRRSKKSKTVAFFHPYCAASGGGERVLWCGVRAIQKKYPDYNIFIYTGDTELTKEQILYKATQRFAIQIDPKNSLAGGFLAIEAVVRFNPEIVIDSMGYAFALPVFKLLGGCRIGAYVHYPTISCNMIDVVATRKATFNNNSAIAKNRILSAGKLIYYKMFAFLYGLAGRATDAVMVNSSWTLGHISALWPRAAAAVVFPPCDVASLREIVSTSEELLASEKHFYILSIGQFRPEKDHRLQIRVVRSLIDQLKKEASSLKPILVLCGGCRNEEDLQRVQELKAFAAQLNVEEYTEFCLNVSYETLLDHLSKSLISIHTMNNEHFGISVVEGMAASSIMVAHKSGGPLMDIVVPSEGVKRVGYLAATEEEYVEQIMQIIHTSPEVRDQIRERARVKSLCFNEEGFEKSFLNNVTCLFVCS